MDVPRLNHRALSCFKISPKAQLTYKLLMMEKARNVLIKQLDDFTLTACEDVHRFTDLSFSSGSFINLSGSLDAKRETIEKLSDMLKKTKAAPAQDTNIPKTKKMLVKPTKQRRGFEFGPMLQGVLTASIIVKTVQVLRARLHVRHLKKFVRPGNCADNVDKQSITQTVTSGLQTEDAPSSSSSTHMSTCPDIVIVGKPEQSNVEKGSSQEEFLPPASYDVVKTNPLKVLLPPIPVMPKETSSYGPYCVVPMSKWGREDDIQVRHQKQTSSQLLPFLKVETNKAGVVNATVVEWHNSFSSFSPQPSPSSKKCAKQAYKFKQDAAVLFEAEDHRPLFKLKQVDSSGFLTYTSVIATKTELWDLGVIVTGLEPESSPVSSEDTAQIMPCDETPKWVDVTVHKDVTAGANGHTAKTINIPEFQSKRFEELEVVVSHIVNPGNFFIQRRDAHEKLQTFFSDIWKENDTLTGQNCIPDIGTKVLGWFPEQRVWCRSEVTKICGVSKDELHNSTEEISIQLEVKRLDYGDSSCVSLSNIKALTAEMAVLPLQAVQVSLAHVSPVNGRDWSDEAVGWFRHMVHKRILYARLYPEGQRVLVDLFLEKGKIQAMRRGASLSLRLTQNGHAKHAQLKNGVGTVRLKMKKKDLEWEKYLISCYVQSNIT